MSKDWAKDIMEKMRLSKRKATTKSTLSNLPYQSMILTKYVQPT